ncbi:kelch-like protein 10 [Trichonephila inaurata madagascariensis]|uniref:Kelch-like protein 10 n=1 Tax=Trichonephila inaurata madagascariensis TaxID=2747483 RepID=A0A8X6Y006_9ARAC|nr:kelch-like protein 10 [Trichonephila inaurata madagascariensis]
MGVKLFEREILKVLESYPGIKTEESFIQHSIISFISMKRCMNIFEIIWGNQKEIFSKAIHGAAHHELDLRFQMLSSLFAELRIGSRNVLSITPEKNFHKVKETVPPEQSGKLVPSPSNLVFVALGWSGNAPAVTIEAYHPIANKWFYIPQNVFVKRAYHGVVMMGILIYVIGGFDGRLCHSTTFCFNIQNRRWYMRPPMMAARCYVTALAFRGMVYALGGYNGDERFRSCERFDPRIRQWRYFSSMNARRSDASGAVHNGKVYVCGGFDGIQVQKSAEIYDPEQDQWTLVPDMLGPRSGQILVSYQGTLLVIGGFDGEIRLRTVERFDEEKNAWVEHVPLHSTRSNFAAAVLDDHLYVIGGYNGTKEFSKLQMRLILRTFGDPSNGFSKNSSSFAGSLNENSPEFQQVQNNNANKQLPLNSNRVNSYLSVQTFDRGTKRHPSSLNLKSANSYISPPGYSNIAKTNGISYKGKTSHVNGISSQQDASYLLARDNRKIGNLKNAKKRLQNEDLSVKENIRLGKKVQTVNLRNASEIPKTLYFTESSLKKDVPFSAMKQSPRSLKNIRSIADHLSPPRSYMQNSLFLFVSICVPLAFAIIYGVWRMRKIKHKSTKNKSVAKYRKILEIYPGKAKRSRKSKNNYKSKKLSNKNDGYVFNSLNCPQNECNSHYFDSHCNINDLDQLSIKKCCCHVNRNKILENLPIIDRLAYNGYMDENNKLKSPCKKFSEVNLLLMDSESNEKLKSLGTIPQKLSAISNVSLQFSVEEPSIIPENYEESQMRLKDVINPADLSSSKYSSSSLSSIYCSNSDFLCNNMLDLEEANFASYPCLCQKNHHIFESVFAGPSRSDSCLDYNMDKYRKNDHIPSKSNASFTSASESLDVMEGAIESQAISNLIDVTEKTKHETSEVRLLKTADFNSSDNSIELEDIIVYE